MGEEVAVLGLATVPRAGPVSVVVDVAAMHPLIGHWNAGWVYPVDNAGGTERRKVAKGTESAPGAVGRVRAQDLVRSTLPSCPADPKTHQSLP